MDTKQRAEVSQYFCNHCGETNTFLNTHPRVRSLEAGKDDCRTCLQGKIVRIEQ